MKKIITILSLFISLILFSQELKYEEVVQVDSTITKQELYNRSRSWFVNNFKEDGAILLVEDSSSGEITGDASLRYNTSKIYFAVQCTIGYVSFKTNIYVKDGRYKYVFHTFKHHGTDCRRNGAVNYGLLTLEEKPPKPENEYPRKAPWNDIKEKTDEKMKLIISGLKEAMNKPHETSNNW
ncbi:DUF4468 domain-containing protein [Chryseobacterium sp. WX]|uniref:DUF4468 domain-containing protein n=1 Tax=Chryseobacterium sp. WX TaxID=3031803 RepID=UPI0024094146|nr:DUF4468 domain-containing protein [Chryseobacterium sp. WX]WFB67017.1 DUF4468 domain-containing protein [Chryseobacterium sp. WX]